MITRMQLNTWLKQELKPDLIKDYCPNGLQVEGTENVGRIVTGVTASQALIDKAVELNADAIIVHHGYFWKGESQVISGIKRKRIGSLIANNINLFAYHLPLDVHPELGNNKQLGQILELDLIEVAENASPSGVVMMGEYDNPKSLSELTSVIVTKLNRTPLIEAAGPETVKKLAWCTGGGQSFIETAIEEGVDTFISGEVSEQTIHVARENRINFIAAGHHATERYGVKALGEKLRENLDVQVTFVDIDNPA